MTGAALPFILCAYTLGAFLLTVGIARAEWANTLAGMLTIACLTLAISA